MLVEEVKKLVELRSNSARLLYKIDPLSALTVMDWMIKERLKKGGDTSHFALCVKKLPIYIYFLC